MQRDAHSEAFALLSSWISPATARLALLPGGIFAHALQEQGLIIPAHRRAPGHSYETVDSALDGSISIR